MAFGVGVSDIITVIKLAKETVEDCRHAPSDFAEASRVSQTLYLMLEGVENEFKNPDSPLCKDDRTRIDFAIHFKNCEASLKPLANLVAKYKSLGSSSIRAIDRMRFPKKEYLEYRGNLAFYTASLSEFLQMVGLGSLGRIEQKVTDINENLPNLMSKLDEMCAEFRIMGDKESLLSDRTDDEKFVWKTFRSKLNDAGFTSNTLRKHEATIFLRLRELTQCGLLDTDGSCSLRTDDEALGSPSPVYRMPFRSSTMTASDESDAEFEKGTMRKSSIRNLRPRKSSDSMRSVPGAGSDLSYNAKKSSLPTGSLSRKSSLAHSEAKSKPLLRAKLDASSEKSHIWRNPQGLAILKGRVLDKAFKNGQYFAVLIDTDKQEVWIPLSNLSEDDLKYVNNATGCAPGDMHQARAQSEERLRNPLESPCRTKKIDDLEDQPIELPRCTRPEILHGKRTQQKPKWVFRKEFSKLPQVGLCPPRSYLMSDMLPMAASRGDFKRVRKLLASGEHVESKGPKSWTETIQSTDGDGNPTSHTERHSYPETTALFRAAHAGHLDVVHFLIGQGADVNTRNGYDGKIGDPILFNIIKNGQEKMTRLLLEYGAKSEAFGPTTALHIASSHPKRNLVRLVLDYGAHIDAKDDLKRTPLYVASVGGFASIVGLLVEEGARTDVVVPGGQSALYKAAGKGRDDIVDLLLRYGADASVGRGRYGETAIYKAAWYNKLEVVEVLIKFEADVNIRNSQKMKSYRAVSEKLLHGFVAGLSNDHAIMNAWGKSPIHAAAYQGHEEMVQILLQSRVELEVTGNDGITPIYLAAQQKHGGVVHLLLNAGAQLETEKHDPVLAILSERNKTKEGKSREIIRKDNERQAMTKIGTSETMVGFVADLTRAWATSRRTGLNG